MHLGPTSTDHRVARLKQLLTKSPSRKPQDPEIVAPRGSSDDEISDGDAEHRLCRVSGQGRVRCDRKR